MSESPVILAVNAGSSSLKITLFTVERVSKSLRKIAASEVSGFTAPPAREKYSRGSFTRRNDLPGVKLHEDAFQHILESFLDDKDLEEVTNKRDITYACHRVVHGGDYTEDQVVDKDTYHKIESLEDLAPLSVNIPHMERLGPTDEPALSDTMLQR